MRKALVLPFSGFLFQPCYNSENGSDYSVPADDEDNLIKSAPQKQLIKSKYSTRDNRFPLSLDSTMVARCLSSGNRLSTSTAAPYNCFSSSDSDESNNVVNKYAAMRKYGDDTSSDSDQSMYRSSSSAQPKAFNMMAAAQPLCLDALSVPILPDVELPVFSRKEKQRLAAARKRATLKNNPEAFEAHLVSERIRDSKRDATPQRIAHHNNIDAKRDATPLRQQQNVARMQVHREKYIPIASCFDAQTRTWSFNLSYGEFNRPCQYGCGLVYCILFFYYNTSEMPY